MLPDIKFPCPHCAQNILVEAAAAGLRAACPHCRGEMVIPAGIDGTAHPGAPAAMERRQGQVREGSGGMSNGGQAVAEVDLLSRFAGDEFATLQAECERLRANTTHAQAELKSIQSERPALRSDLATWKQKATTLEGHVELQRQRLSATETQLEAREAELKVQSAEVARRGELARALEAQLQSVQSELRAARTELSAATALADEMQSRSISGESALLQVRAELAASQTAVKALTDQHSALQNEGASLRRSLSQTETGKELVSTRERFEAAESERQRLAQRVVTLENDLSVSVVERQRLEALVTDLRKRTAEALQRSEAVSEDRIKQDNEVLRGIIARQNAELEQGHRIIVRLKRARLGLRIVYGLFGLSLAALAMLALKVLPGLGF